jgi:DNA-binding transcriptional LysR family regulator
MFELLQTFVFVAEEGTITAAARRAHVTQPALTSALKRLEALVGATLVVRSRPRVALTAAGSALLPHARAALTSARDGLRAVEEVAGLAAGEVRLGAGATACAYFLPPILAEFRRRYPRVAIVLREATHPDLALGLAAGEFDLAVVSRSPSAGATRHEAGDDLFCEDELVLVRAPELVDASPERTPFVTFPRGAHARAALDELFPGATIAMEIASIAAVKANVRAGMGLGLVSRRAALRDLARGDLVLVPSPLTPRKRSLVIAHRGLSRLPPAAAALRELLLARRPAPVTAPATAATELSRRRRPRSRRPHP